MVADKQFARRRLLGGGATPSVTLAVGCAGGGTAPANPAGEPVGTVEFDEARLFDRRHVADIVTGRVRDA
jgi:hypothetical protein